MGSIRSHTSGGQLAFHLTAVVIVAIWGLTFISTKLLIGQGLTPQEILHFLVPSFVTYVVIEIYSGALRGMGDSWLPMLITMFGVCALRVLWILIAVPIHRDITTVVFSYPLTWSVTTVLFLIYYHRFGPMRHKPRTPKP